MAKLTERIDGTRTHLTRESSMLVSRTRRAGDSLRKALKEEAREWRGYLETGRDTLQKEIGALSAPRGLERATLRLADEALARAHATIHSRLGRLERELSRTAPRKKTKSRPSAKASRSSRAPSRRLVTAATDTQAA